MKSSINSIGGGKPMLYLRFVRQFRKECSNKWKITTETAQTCPEDVILDNKLEKKCKSFFDAFSGTSTVGEFFKDRFKIIANDNLYMSYVISQAKLNTPDGKYKYLEMDPFEYFNSTDEITKGFIYKNCLITKQDQKTKIEFREMNDYNQFLKEVA